MEGHRMATDFHVFSYRPWVNTGVKAQALATTAHPLSYQVLISLTIPWGVHSLLLLFACLLDTKAAFVYVWKQEMNFMAAPPRKSFENEETWTLACSLRGPCG